MDRIGEVDQRTSISNCPSARRLDPTKWRRVGVLAAAVVLIAELLGGCGATRQPTSVVLDLLDVTGSDSNGWQREADDVNDVVLPYVQSHHDRLVIGVVNSSSYSEFFKISDVSFTSSSDNPDVYRPEFTKESVEVRSDVHAALFGTNPAVRPPGGSDIFGALLWAANVMTQVKVSQPQEDVLILDSDGLDNEPPCNLTPAVIATPTARSIALTNCAPTLPGFPRGTTLWASGLGADPGISTRYATDIVAFYELFADRDGLRIGPFGPELLPQGSTS